MNNEFKLVSVEPDQIHQMAFEEGQPAENGDGYLFTSEEFDLFVERLLTAAAPQPPALGGVPAGLDLQRIVTEALMGMIAAVTSTSPPANEPPPPFIQAGIDRAVSRISAHLAPLQAELTRMNSMFDELATAVGFSKERCEQAGDSPLDCANQLQAEIARLNDELDERGQWDTAQLKVIHDLNDDVARLKARCDEMEALLREVAALDPRGEFMGWQLDGRIESALSKPAGSEQV